jgi:hypothetical protein
MKIVINPIRPALSHIDQDFHVLVRLQSEHQEGFKRTPLNFSPGSRPLWFYAGPETKRSQALRH